MFVFSLGKRVGLLCVFFLTGERGWVAMCMCVFFHWGKGWGCYMYDFSLGKGMGLLCVIFHWGERGGAAAYGFSLGKGVGLLCVCFFHWRKGWGCYVFFHWGKR